MSALTAGKSAPDFRLPGMDGNTFSLTQALARGPVVLAFFKISCPVCQYALPFLERIYQAYQGKPVSVVAVSQNDRNSTGAFLREYGITLPVLLDEPPRYPVSNAYGLTNVPTVFLLAPDGEIELSSVGWSRSELEQIHRQLADAAGKQAGQLFRPGEQVAEFRPG
jgi:peroxiredoxin